MADTKLQQAAAKLVSKEADRAQYRKLRELQFVLLHRGKASSI
jgi:hypothetical protein